MALCIGAKPMVDIVRLTPTGPVTARAPLRRGQPGFRVDLEQAAEASPAAPSPSASALGGLLALQEGLIGAALPDSVRDREARRRGREMLDDLASLQRGLLRGRPDPALLRRLAEAGEIDAADPGLRALLVEIALRARLELARYGII